MLYRFLELKWKNDCHIIMLIITPLNEIKLEKNVFTIGAPTHEKVESIGA